MLRDGPRRFNALPVGSAGAVGAAPSNRGVHSSGRAGGKRLAEGRLDARLVIVEQGPDVDEHRAIANPGTVTLAHDLISD